MTRRRLDAELVRRGLVTTRAEAQQAVRAGFVTIGGAPASKPATMVADDESLGISAAVRRYVSRGGEKLSAALDRFGVDPAGRDCLDAGASTGGFTDRLLQGGAARVAALDVGYGQLAWTLRNDPRVVVLERTNVRDLGASSVPFRASLAVADLSFISLRHAVRPILLVTCEDADLVVLVKPQFEAGRADVDGGVVRDPRVWHRVLIEVVGAFEAAGAAPQAAMASPLRGPAGNVEFLVHLRRGAPAGAIDLAPAVDEGRRVAAG